MTNPIEQALVTESGILDAQKMLDAMPGENIEMKNVLPHIGRLLTQTKLSDDFISKHFKLLPFDLLIEYNHIPEFVVEREMEHVVGEVIEETILNEDADVFMAFLNAGYSTETNEKVIGAMIDYLTMRPDVASEEAVNVATTIINAQLDAVSKDFILGHIGDVGYMATNAMLRRSDVTLDEVVNVIDAISVDELSAILWEFADVTVKSELLNPDDTVRTMENKRRVLTLLKLKTESLLQKV